MKKEILLVALAMITACTQAPEVQWQPVDGKIMTRWASEVTPDNVLPEYPRPLMERSEWLNLNGMWNYAIVAKDQPQPAESQGQILVPFAIESALSGVGATVGAENDLWYTRTFTVPSSWKKRDVMLNFGAVDWKADVYVNDTFVGSHEGGYTPFSFNVTQCLRKGTNKLAVKVWDPTDLGYQPHGKQVITPKGIWYTSVTGIWQTVWMEPVQKQHITAVRTVPDLDNSCFRVKVEAVGAGCEVFVGLYKGTEMVSQAQAGPGSEMEIPVLNPQLWSPDSPFLYDMKVTLWKDGKAVDQVSSYCAMRKISVKEDEKGIKRLALNDRILFQYGPLDQGWWPDGLYTAPTDEALLNDIKVTKELGFNMIRKHVKVEPARWYFHCDREGMLVWQDMPSGDLGNEWDDQHIGGGTDRDRTAESAADYYAEWEEIMNLVHSNPCVVVFVPFNESWGQFDTGKVAQWTASKDPSRLVNPASGGNWRDCGDILDVHHYPNPYMQVSDPSKVNVLGEYGGIGLAVEGHLWWNDRNWGYVQFKTSDEVTDQYVKYAEELKDYVFKGHSAAVYTQTTDCEGEVNGLMTYDREVIKMNVDKVREANEAVISLISE